MMPNPVSGTTNVKKNGQMLYQLEMCEKSKIQNHKES